MAAVWYLAFLIGVVSGLRAFAGLVAVCWAARLRWIGLDGTKLAFLGFLATPYIVSVLGAVELVTDQLPSTPSRKVPQQFAPRVLMGALCGAALGLAGQNLAAGIIAGVLGSLVGTYGGAWMRGTLAGLFGKDLPAALLEDVIAYGIAFFVVTRTF